MNGLRIKGTPQMSTLFTPQVLEVSHMPVTLASMISTKCVCKALLHLPVCIQLPHRHMAIAVAESQQALKIATKQKVDGRHL